jgi:hypothetical protein
MDITVAYFHPLFHPDVVKQDLEQIRATGAGSIVYAIHEQERQRWPRDLERGLRIAQDSGLKVSLSLGRYGNLFAGPSLVPSWYTFQHPHSRVMDRHGHYHDITCFNHEPFRHWLYQEIECHLRRFPVNAILIDEPRYSEVICFCSVCRALCPDVADLPGFRRRSLIAFLSEVCACIKRVCPQVKTTIALLPQDLGILEELAQVHALDTLGCHPFWTLLREDPTQVEQWSRTVAEAARLHEKHSQLWLQNFALDESGEQQLEGVFTSMLAAEPDEIGCYYYWRNNEEPERVWQATRNLLRRVPRRQLFWNTNKHAAAQSAQAERQHS